MYAVNSERVTEAVVAALLRASEIVCELPGIAEMDINPLLVDADEEHAIGAVASAVARTWMRTASPSEREHLLHRKPSIPPELDRALLVDLSTRLGAYEISEPVRFRLRTRFWEAAETAAHE